MKLPEYKFFLTIAVALTMVGGATAADTTASSPTLGLLSTATAAELPAKAAGLVLKADAKNLKATTVDVVKAAVGLNPAAAPAIVGSIAQASPAMAPTASATAVGLVPDQVLIIARAAAAASPTKAGAIVEAICRVLPGQYDKVAEAVAEVAPGASKEILTAVTTAIPGLKGVMEKTLSGYQGNVPSVSSVLGQVVHTQTSMDIVALASAPATAAQATSVTPLIVPQAVSSSAPTVPGSGTQPITPSNPQSPLTPSRPTHTYSAP